MEAILKFKEACKELQNEDVYKELVAARDANDGNEALQGEIGEFNLVRLELNNEMMKDDKDEAKLESLENKANELYTSIMNSAGMQRYNAAKQGIEEFMEYVNAILNTAIEGGNPMQVEKPQQSACGEGGCSGCSGCH